MVCIIRTIILYDFRYNIDGPKKGKLEHFNNNLPGLPDNIRKSSLGGYWVGLATVRKPAFSMLDLIASRPWIRSIVTKVNTHNTLFSGISFFYGRQWEIENWLLYKLRRYRQVAVINTVVCCTHIYHFWNSLHVRQKTWNLKYFFALGQNVCV